ncbi:phosphotransferase [Staphylospora marina]|uniref:phosphotransferase n=1 Tax=Staphylospora marina TaxID=2490858 RepID=UPI0013DE75D6|nr:phosphotransferase [Staphylospora marina]
MNVPPFSRAHELGNVFRQYGWEPSEVVQVGGVFRVVTKEGVYALKRSGAPPEKLALLHRMLHEVSSGGFPHLLPWEKTRRGEVVAETDESAWYATPWIGNPDGTKTEPDAEEVVRALARFHRATETFADNYPRLKIRAGEARVSRWKRKRERLRQIIGEIEKKEYPTPFEQCLLRGRESVDKSLQFAILGLERFIETEGGEAPVYALCHRRLHPTNVVADETGFWFIDFDHAQFDSPARDLAAAIRRFTRPGEGADRAFDLFQAYSEERPLSPKEKRLTALYLAYPANILKSLARYGEQPRVAHHEVNVSGRLEKEIEQLEGMQDLIRSLWPRRKRAEGTVRVAGRNGMRKPPGRGRPR